MGSVVHKVCKLTESPGTSLSILGKSLRENPDSHTWSSPLPVSPPSISLRWGSSLAAVQQYKAFPAGLSFDFSALTLSKLSSMRQLGVLDILKQMNIEFDATDTSDPPPGILTTDRFLWLGMAMLCCRRFVFIELTSLILRDACTCSHSSQEGY